MTFAIIDDFQNKDRGKIALLIRFNGLLAEFMIRGGEVIQVERFTRVYGQAYPATIERELEQYKAHLGYWQLMEHGFFGWRRMQDTEAEREAVMPKLRAYIHELESDLIRANDSLWLLEAGQHFDRENEKTKKEAWLFAVRSAPRNGEPGEQLSMLM